MRNVWLVENFLSLPLAQNRKKDRVVFACRVAPKQPCQVDPAGFWSVLHALPGYYCALTCEDGGTNRRGECKILHCIFCISLRVGCLSRSGDKPEEQKPHRSIYASYAIV